MEQLLSLPEFAKEIHRSPAFVARALMLKKLIPTMNVGSRHLFNKEKVKEFNKNPFQISRKELPW